MCMRSAELVLKLQRNRFTVPAAKAMAQRLEEPRPRLEEPKGHATSVTVSVIHSIFEVESCPQDLHDPELSFEANRVALARVASLPALGWPSHPNHQP